MDTSEYQRGEEDDGSLGFMAELPKVTPRGEPPLLQWKGFWVVPSIVKAVMAIETQFEPLPSDIILTSFPKTGTTWLKALATTILNFDKSKQNSASQVDDPLLTQNPHQLVPFLELECFGEHPKFDINKMTSSPRVFNTHLPYSLLPENIKKSGCKLVYITRNPMDTFVSRWHFFYQQKRNCDVTMEESFANFCQGVILPGPYFDHVLEYWRVSNERPGTLFLKYEELKQNPHTHVKRLAEFLGCSLTSDEIGQVVWRCSHDRLSNLAVNKDPSNVHWTGWDFSLFFRRGIVGDSRDYLTPDMVEQLREMAREKWERYGLTLSRTNQ